MTNMAEICYLKREREICINGRLTVVVCTEVVHKLRARSCARLVIA